MNAKDPPECDLRPLPRPLSPADPKDPGVGVIYSSQNTFSNVLIVFIVSFVLLLVFGGVLVASFWLNRGYEDTFSGVENSTVQNSSWNAEAFTERAANVTQEVPLSDAVVVKEVNMPVLRSGSAPEVLPVLQSPQPGPQLPEIVLRPTKLCAGGTSSNSSHNILLAIVSDPEDDVIRGHYREIWKNYLDIIHADLLFVTASSPLGPVQEMVRQESALYGDVLQIRNFTNPSSKYLKLLAALDWVSNNCHHSLLIRSNIDVLIQPHSLNVVLQSLTAKPGAQIPFIAGEVIQEEQTGPSRISSTFPRFVYGSFYIISRSAFKPLIQGCRATRPIPLEEVYLTGICAEHAKIPHMNLGELYEFQMERDMKLWRKMFSCLPSHVLTVSNVGKDNIILYLDKAVRAGCYIADDQG